MKFYKVDDKKVQVWTVQAILTLWPPGGTTVGGLEKILGDDDHDNVNDNDDDDGGDNDNDDNDDDGDDEMEEDSVDEQAFISD